jgi:subtilisin family serine protease
LNGIFTGLGGSLINFGGDPVEVFGVGVGAPLVVQIAIGNFGGPAPNIMKYVTFGSGGPLEYATNSATSYGHSNAANMAGVGAAAFFNTAAFNPGVCEPACVNSFSALGGVPILFDLADNRINEVRERPNFVGPDGGNTTFFGADLSFPVPGTDEPDGFGNFFGTSASAPHAAAGAALIKQTAPSLSPSEIYAILEDTATDMVPVGSTINPGAGPGFDFRTGYGFINLDLAVDAAATDPRNANKRFVCHKGRKTLSISKNAVPAHLAHGDKFGPCE